MDLLLQRITLINENTNDSDSLSATSTSRGLEAYNAQETTVSSMVSTASISLTQSSPGLPKAPDRAYFSLGRMKHGNIGRVEAVCQPTEVQAMLDFLAQRQQRVTHYSEHEQKEGTLVRSKANVDIATFSKGLGFVQGSITSRDSESFHEDAGRQTPNSREHSCSSAEEASRMTANQLCSNVFIEELSLSEGDPFAVVHHPEGLVLPYLAQDSVQSSRSSSVTSTKQETISSFRRWIANLRGFTPPSTVSTETFEGRTGSRSLTSSTATGYSVLSSPIIQEIQLSSSSDESQREEDSVSRKSSGYEYGIPQVIGFVSEIPERELDDPPDRSRDEAASPYCETER